MSRLFQKEREEKREGKASKWPGCFRRKEKRESEWKGGQTVSSCVVRAEWSDLVSWLPLLVCVCLVEDKRREGMGRRPEEARTPASDTPAIRLSLF